MRPLLAGAEIYRRSSYGSGHPLAIARVSATLDLIRALGWCDPDQYRIAPLARPDQLAGFHDPAYIRVVQRAEQRQRVPATDRARHHVGANGNPIFPEVYRRPATSSGATLAALDWLAEPGIVYCLPGGTHHAMADRAAGFCYFNDAVLALRKALDSGMTRVAYLDLDAHHGDGVEAGIGADNRALCLSIHEAGRWPYTGATLRPPGTRVRNLAVPAGFHDDDLACLVGEVVVPLLAGWAPELLIVQGGCDALSDDPMSGLALSNRALWAVIGQVTGLAPRVIVTGGGGYNPWAVARCWAGIWATLAGHPVPDRLPLAAESVLRALTWRHRLGRTPPEHWFTTMADAPNRGQVCDQVRALIAPALDGGP